MSGKSFTVLSLVILAVFSRLIPHPWNFTAVGAISLFAGAHLRPKVLAYLVPVLGFFVSDLIIGLHNTMYFTYGALILSTALGVFFLKSSTSALRIGALSLSSSLMFFLISNFGVWLVSGLYTTDMSGLLSCFAMALPFFQGQILGDLLYAGVLFSVYSVVAKRAGWVLATSK